MDLFGKRYSVMLLKGLDAFPLFKRVIKPLIAPPHSHRACFKKLPRILSFNTMRYTFNMVTMMKEKVNTHFSFPLRLDMTPYTEDFLMGKGERKEGSSECPRTPRRTNNIKEDKYLHHEGEILKYVMCCRFSGRGRGKSHGELRVRPHRCHRAHGHSRRRPLLQLHQRHRQPSRLQEQQVVSAEADISFKDFITQFVRFLEHGFKHNACSCCRYLFNDAEVKSFDSAQLASECFGGEMTVRSKEKSNMSSSVTSCLADVAFLSFRRKPTTPSRTSSWISPLRR